MQSVLDEFPGAAMRVIAVWEPVLNTDLAAPGEGVLARLHDRRAMQFWDRPLFTSKAIQPAVLAAPVPAKGSLSLVSGEVVWDYVAVFGPDARWDAQLPAPVFHGGPVIAMGGPFREALQSLTKRP